MRLQLLLTTALAAAVLFGTNSIPRVDAALPPANPYAGAYSGYPPGVRDGFAWTITISSKGEVSGSVGIDFAYWYENGTLRGKVDGSGVISCRGNWTYTVFSPDSGSRTTGGRIRFLASVALDGSGNLVGTMDDGTTFTWSRR